MQKCLFVMGLFSDKTPDARDFPITTQMLEDLGFGMTAQQAVKHVGETQWVHLVTVQFLWNNGIRDYPKHLKKEHWVMRKGLFPNEIIYTYTIGELIDYLDGLAR